MSVDPSNLENLLDQVKGLIFNQPASQSKKTDIAIVNSQFKSPLRGAYYNSGDYSPNKATDARHTSGHKGVDLRAAGGTPIYSIGPGIVLSAGTDPKGGNTVTIRHTNKIKAYYAHLGTVKVKTGDKVSSDTIIGSIGDSGNAKGTWPHLHIQIWKNGNLIDPGTIFYVPPYTQPDKNKERVWLSEKEKNKARSFSFPQASLDAKMARINKLLNSFIKTI